ncbi:MAG: YqiA/YcfP family alpha/beta fold hydrolase [Opitutales bacterium]
MEYKTQIYYVHGFASGANSGTFLKLREEFPWTKALEYDSALKFEDNLESLLGQLGKDDEMRLFVGSSLGGLYTLALAMSDKAKSKCILVNPCVQPTESLKKYIGIQKNFSTGKDFDFSKEAFESYPSGLAEKFSGVECTVLLAKDDEVLDSNIARNLLKNKAKIVDIVGGHRLSDYEILFKEVNEKLKGE